LAGKHQTALKVGICLAIERPWNAIEISSPILASSNGPPTGASKASPPIFGHQPRKSDRCPLPHHLADGRHLSANTHGGWTQPTGGARDRNSGVSTRSRRRI